MSREKKITNNWQLIVEIRKRNPAVDIKYDSTYSYISINCEPEGLILPTPFYYNEKNGITNKHDTSNGSYLTLQVW